VVHSILDIFLSLVSSFKKLLNKKICLNFNLFSLCKIPFIFIIANHLVLIRKIHVKLQRNLKVSQFMSRASIGYQFLYLLYEIELLEVFKLIVKTLYLVLLVKYFSRRGSRNTIMSCLFLIFAGNALALIKSFLSLLLTILINFSYIFVQLLQFL